MVDDDPVSDISNTIGYRFVNENLLRQAFTRRTYQTEYKLSGCSEELVDRVFESIEFLKQGNVDYEFRTTVVRELHTAEDMIELAKEIEGVSKYYIQSYVDSENVIERKYSAYTKEEIEKIAQSISFVHPILRGIE